MDVSVVVRLALGLVLLLAFSAKAQSPTSVGETLQNFLPVPQRALVPASAALLATEVVLGTLLVIGWEQRVALTGAGVVLACFAAVLWRTGRREGATPCGCLGTLVKLRAGQPSAIVNALASLGSFAAAAATPSYGVDTGLGRLGSASGIVLLLSAVLLAGGYWLTMYVLSVQRVVDERIAGEVAQ
jgi:hypothetical protein